MTLALQVSTPQNGRVPQVVRALLLDDSTYDRARIRRLTNDIDMPIQLDEVSSLKELEGMIRRFSYDLVLIDYRLPIGSGLQALTFLKQDPINKHAAAIMITGNAELETAVAAMRMGCHDFLTKDQMNADQLCIAMLNAIKSAQKSRLNDGTRFENSDDIENQLWNLESLVDLEKSQDKPKSKNPKTSQMEKFFSGINDDDGCILH